MMSTATRTKPSARTPLVRPFVPEGGRVFLADDDPFIRRALVRAFAAQGFEVIAADNGSTMLDSLRHFRDWDQDHQSVLVTDVEMPLVGGVELARQAALEGWKFPVVFLSGNPARAAVEPAIRAGDVHFFPKPFALHDLLATVGRLLSPGALTA